MELVARPFCLHSSGAGDKLLDPHSGRHARARWGRHPYMVSPTIARSFLEQWAWLLGLAENEYCVNTSAESSFSPSPLR